jgi:hypothetical protein
MTEALTEKKKQLAQARGQLLFFSTVVKDCLNAKEQEYSISGARERKNSFDEGKEVD